MPPALAERCIKAGCPPGGTVLDPFAGSGTTLAAARKLGRKSSTVQDGFDFGEAAL
jgi:DNA modification methylase